ncbi:MAG: hypothetical protein QUS08_02035, partial [Methanothrix sp.]|nr:hypothetical protein [Methanothrix sp.]
MVQESREILDCTQFFVENLPPLVRLIIISRTQVSLALSRLRVMGEVVEVTEKDLEFTPGEVGLIFGKVFGMQLDEETVANIHARSQGWVAGIILFYHAIRGRDRQGIDDILDKLQVSGRGISEYLEENVFSLLPTEIRSFLLRTSLLPRLSSSLCDRYLGTRDSAGILERLEKNHLFTFQMDEAGVDYAYHHLFHDFLRSRLAREYGKAEIAALHIRAAEIFEEQGMSEEAIDHYLSAGAYPAVTRLLAGVGTRLLGEGRMNLLTGFLDRIPGEIASREPWIVYLQAYIHIYTGRNSEAVEGFQKARDLFEEQGIQVGVDLCEYRLGSLFIYFGHFRKAEEQLTRLLRSPTCDPTVYPLLLPNLIHIEVILENHGLSDQYFQEGMAIQVRIADRVQREEMKAWLLIIHCVRYFMSGDFSMALSRLQEAGLLMGKSRNYLLHSLYHSQEGIVCFLAGRYAEGLESSATGLSL